VNVAVTHPDKVLFPEDGYTKADMVEYYLAVADVMLPHMRRHPLAMLRFNEGIHGERFFHKQAPKYFPEYIDRVEVPKAKGTTTYPICDNEDALAYIANHNCIEFHLLPVRAEDLRYPDRLVFDLDPSVEDFSEVREAARWVHDLLDEVGLTSYVMTSGSRGLHIWVPLDRKSSTDEVVDFATATAALLVARHPESLTTEFTKVDRGEKIYVDVARNAPAQHAIAPYSLRAKPGAPAATPIEWTDLDDPDLSPQRWTMKTITERLDADPWKQMYRRARSLDRARHALDRLSA
jgi:bifunctional non-homologous end joining protein LigD